MELQSILTENISFQDLIKQYDDDVRKVSTGQDEDYTTGCLSDFAYFL